MSKRERGNLVDPFNHAGRFRLRFIFFRLLLFELYENKTCSKNFPEYGRTILQTINYAAQAMNNIVHIHNVKTL